MYVTWNLILSICAGFSAICLSIGYIIKIVRGLKKPGEEVSTKVKDNKSRLDKQDERLDKMDQTLDYLVSANNLVIRSLFTVLGELAANNDSRGHIAKAQGDIQKFLTPVDKQHEAG